MIHTLTPSIALLAQPYAIALRCAVRMRPNVSAGLLTSQSGVCSLMLAIIPNTDPTSNQITANANARMAT